MTSWEARETSVGAALRTFISSDGFSCVGAKMALRRGTLLHRHYSTLGALDWSRKLYQDLRSFAERREEIDLHFATFIATFDTPVDLDEATFETALWQQLQLLHDLDGDAPVWHPSFDPSPASDRFGYCLDGHPFFVVGMHPGASRLSRRFAYPALAFNSHEQFERLHQMGVFRRMRSEIRRRELTLQGSINPSFVDYPGREARQYAGRATEPDWNCPFQPRTTTLVIAQTDTGASITRPTQPSHHPPPATQYVRCARTKLVLLWDGSTPSLLDLCNDYGVPVDNLCRSGVCGHCAVPLLAGEVEYQLHPVVQPPPGHILLCVTEPATEIELDL